MPSIPQKSEKLSVVQQNRELGDGCSNEESSAEPQDAKPSEIKPKRRRIKHQKKAGFFCKGMKVTLCPTEEQANTLARWAGASRWVWNWGLELQNDHYRNTGKHLSSNTLSNQLTAVRKTEELSWLNSIPRTCLTMALNNLNSAWSNYFDGLSGKRKDKPGKPDFWSKHQQKDTLNFQVDRRHSSCFDNINHTLRLAGFGVLLGEVAVQCSENPAGRISTISISQKSNTWRAGLSLLDVPQELLIRKPEKTKIFEDLLDPEGLAALDASIPFGAVASNDGSTTFSLADKATREAADKQVKKKLKYERMVARKRDHRMLEMGLDPKKPIPKGTKLKKSNRQIKVERTVAEFDLKAMFCRKDLIHKFTTELVRNHHTIVVETLSLKGMAKSFSKGFRRRFHQACMGEIIRQLEYKCQWYGRTLIKVDKWFPSSKRCSNTACHQKNNELQLKDRAWVCPHCSAEHQRDDNAAFNLWQEGWRLLKQTSKSDPRNVGRCSGVSRDISPDIAETTTVGPTDRQARRAVSSLQAASSGLSVGVSAMKRESSSRLFASKSGMEPGEKAVG